MDPSSQPRNLVPELLKYYVYCTISVNLAGHVTCYTPAKIFISEPLRIDRYIPFFVSGSEIFLPFFDPFWAFFSPIAQMVSADGEIHRYMHYISVISEGPLRVTAKLIEMVQYCTHKFSIFKFDQKLKCL